MCVRACVHVLFASHMASAVIITLNTTGHSYMHVYMYIPHIKTVNEVKVTRSVTSKLLPLSVKQEIVYISPLELLYAGDSITARCL